MSDALASSDNPDLSEIDLTQRELFRHGFPYDVFETLRQEAPVWWHPQTPGCVDTDGRGFWVLSRHADIQAASRDAARRALAPRSARAARLCRAAIHRAVVGRCPQHARRRS